jgi:hypothetical protein
MEKCHKKSNTGATLTSGVALWGRNQMIWRVELFVGFGGNPGVERDPQGNIVDGFGFELGTDGEYVHIMCILLRKVRFIMIILLYYITND